MYVSFYPADRVQNGTFGFDDLVGQVMIKTILDLRRDHRKARFGVPCDVKVDLRVNGARHKIKR
jgi:hypothetical protein